MFNFIKQSISSFFGLKSTDTTNVEKSNKNFTDAKITILSKKVEVKVIKHQVNVESILERQKAYLQPQLKNDLSIPLVTTPDSVISEPTVVNSYQPASESNESNESNGNFISKDEVNDLEETVLATDIKLDQDSGNVEVCADHELNNDAEEIIATESEQVTTADASDSNLTTASSLLKFPSENATTPDLTYNVNINDNLVSNNSSVSKDVAAKLIVSKLHNDSYIDKSEKVTITDSCTYNGNDIFIGSNLTNQRIRLIDLISPNNIHLNLYSDRVKGVSVDVVNKQFGQCSINVRNQILRLLMDRDRLGSQYIGDDIVILRCVIDDDLFGSLGHLVILKEPIVYNLRDNLSARVILYLFVSNRDVGAFDKSLGLIIKKIKKLKESANLFGNISSIEGIWQEIAAIDWKFEKDLADNPTKTKPEHTSATTTKTN